ncbi:hypothetical protein [Acinetobacter chengduensis]|uniref:Uncharacterized protein n=1 Tax=Acinetobacter chengduensis TaxID=2420890 RepID=A0ABX9TQW8_9GAMM|nr:hypothetical protein [Acinetobacter chengduensis]RLL16628.1 hypothetical protein D9K81_17940 [Acinetobacter chengduensis]
MTSLNTAVKSIVVKKRTDTTTAKADETKNTPQGVKNTKPNHKRNGKKKSHQKGNGHQNKRKAKHQADNTQYTDEMLQAMTREELNKLALDQNDDIARISNQLTQAKALQKSAGVKVDNKWLGQATCAKRIKTNLVSRIYTIINKQKKILNEQKGATFERTFMVMAKELLSESQYEQIMNSTHVEVALKAA